ncbi:MAG: hypothetical protein K6G25_06490 [Bacteroidales bacterium]|nr:hypothetical protein [Bacteroidales bacterium]
MSIIADIEAKIKANPMYGVTFSIDPEAYDCNIVPMDRVYFGDNHTFTNGGTTYNYQPVIVDGKEVADLEEIQPYGLFEPMRTSFIVYFEDDEKAKPFRKSKHYLIGPYDYPQMRFATLQQLVDFLKIK